MCFLLFFVFFVVPSSSSAQCLKYMHFISRVERRIQTPHLFAVDEDTHMRSNVILLVYHAKSDSGELPVQVFEQLCHSRTGRIDFFELIRVREQRAGDIDLHFPISAASTA